MEAILFCGIQATGKSTFYRRYFAATHAHISLDVLKTRRRESRASQACLEARQPFVIDNTNPQSSTRMAYIAAAKAANFRVVGYYFQSQLQESLARNAAREPSQIVPLVGVLSTYNQLQIPRWDEGFDALFYVQMEADGSFSIHDWNEEMILAP